MIRSFDQLFELARSKGRKRVVLGAAQDVAALSALVEAANQGLASGLLIGDKTDIDRIMQSLGDYDHRQFEIVDQPDAGQAALEAARIVGDGEADILMKGKISTSSLLKAVLSSETHLRTGTLLSDIVVFEDPRPGEQHLTFVSDGGVNIAPTLEQKAQIISNAVKVARALGYDKPRVAVLSASEYVIPTMQSSVHAHQLKEMNERGEMRDCIVDGPFALDNALSLEDARLKGVTSPIAGKAQILIVPDIECGNIFAKGLVYYGGIMITHVIMGAKAPILICSRTDPPRAKLTSIALAISIL